MGRHPAKKKKYARDTREGQAAKMEVKSDQKTAKVETSDRHFSNRDYGRLVWGKIAGSRTWPGIIVPHYECGVRAPSAERVWIFWFGDNRVSQVPLSKLSSFKENFGTFYVCARIPKFQTGITVCIQELQHQSGLPQGNSEETLRQWANEGFPNATDYKRHAAVPFSSKVVKYLGYIKKAKNLGGHSSDSSDSLFPVTSSSSSDSDSSDADERRKWRPKACFLKLARQGKYDIEQLCIACHRTDCQIVAPHPYFVGSVCKICKTDLDENSMDMEAGLNVRCVVCASPGKLLICDSADCERVFCFGCVELLVAPSAVNRILRASPWYCFLCEPFNPCTHGLLKPRPEWREVNPSKKPASWMSNFEEEVPDPSSFPKKPLRVLSVFDGIATGLVALDKLGLEVEVYYSCEVDEKATTVVASNFGSRVTLLGKVEELTEKNFLEKPPIVIDARYFSPQSRPRCFWGNIPGMSRHVPPQLECNHKLNQYIDKIGNRKAVVDKLNCITTNCTSLRIRCGKDLPVKMNNCGDMPWITELEKIFGLPPHYTDNGNLAVRERHILLGRAWSVPVIQHIFEPLCQYFPCKKDTSEIMEEKGLKRE